MRSLRLIRSHKGQVLVESAISMMALGILLTTLLYSFYYFYGRLMVHHVGYSGVICAAQRQPPKVCETWVRDKLKTYLPFGDIRHLIITNNRSQFHITLVWALKSLHRVEYRKSLRYGS